MIKFTWERGLKIRKADYKDHKIVVYRRPHGKWCCEIIKIGEGIVWFEGYFTTSLPTLVDVRKFIRSKLG